MVILVLSAQRLRQLSFFTSVPNLFAQFPFCCPGSEWMPFRIARATVFLATPLSVAAAAPPVVGELLSFAALTAPPVAAGGGVAPAEPAAAERRNQDRCSQDRIHVFFSFMRAVVPALGWYCMLTVLSRARIRASLKPASNALRQVGLRDARLALMHVRRRPSSG